jgi:polar amino acid transport system substrate-binding protein
MARRLFKVIGFGVFVILLLAFLVRSCSSYFKTHEKIYRIARDPSWYPLDLTGKERNMLAFTNELLSDIAQTEKIQFNLFSASWDKLYDGLNRGEYDAILTQTNPNPMQEAKYIFSDPLYLTGPVVVVHKNSDIRSFEDLGGEMVGIKAGSALVVHTPDYPTILFRTYPTVHQALDQLVDDEIDAVIIDSLPYWGTLESYYTKKLKIAGRPLSKEGLRLVAKKDPASTPLIEKINAGLKEALKNGTYHSFIEKWHLVDTLESKG